MKKIILLQMFVLTVLGHTLRAQSYNSAPREFFGTTINLGAGIGYYGYMGRPAPAIMLNVELDIARNITLAPFIGFHTYSRNYYWGSPNDPYRNYSYRETVIPVGVRGAYYFDQLLKAGDKWDFYAASTLGFAYHTVTWDSNYNGDRSVSSGPSPLYATAHIGSRLHVTQKFGLFLDLSTGLSTFGLSFKL
jgi:hypothetical protein